VGEKRAKVQGGRVPVSVMDRKVGSCMSISMRDGELGLRLKKS
jgi:hypothetical protein